MDQFLVILPGALELFLPIFSCTNTDGLAGKKERKQILAFAMKRQLNHDFKPVDSLLVCFCPQDFYCFRDLTMTAVFL